MSESSIDYVARQRKQVVKLVELEKATGIDSLEMARDASIDGIAEGICMNPGCDYTDQVEPDCDNGWCEECNTPTVSSVLVLMDLI